MDQVSYIIYTCSYVWTAKHWINLKIAPGNCKSNLKSVQKVLLKDVPQVSGWHWRLFDGDKGPSFVQKPHIVLLFKNLNRQMKEFTLMVWNKATGKVLFSSFTRNLEITTIKPCVRNVKLVNLFMSAVIFSHNCNVWRHTVKHLTWHGINVVYEAIKVPYLIPFDKVPVFKWIKWRLIFRTPQS